MIIAGMVSKAFGVQRSVETGAREPIFIVGVPRSGTTLLSAMLCVHSRLSCGPESHLFPTLTQEARARILDPACWPERAVEHWYEVRHQTGTVPDNHGFSREELRSYMSARSPSIQAMLESITELYMRKCKKQRWVEKTPDHMFHVELIRSLYPSSPILRIVRDPRDVALSLTKVPWGPGSYLRGLCVWRRFEDHCRDFFESDPLSLTVMYEDLVAEPEASLERICGFIGEAFEPNMVSREGAAEHVNKTREPWKLDVAKPLDLSRLRGWMNKLSEEQKLQAECILGNALRSYGYPHREEPPRHYVEVYPPQALASFPEAFSGMVAGGARFWPVRPGERPQRRIYLGDPDQAGLSENWFGHETAGRLARSLSLAGSLVRDRLLLRRIEWVAAELSPRPSRCGSLVRTTLKMLRIPPRKSLVNEEVL